MEEKIRIDGLDEPIPASVREEINDSISEALERNGIDHRVTFWDPANE